jgi:hypothetical protein
LSTPEHAQLVQGLQLFGPGVTIAPPSRVVMVLTGPKLKQTRSPVARTGLPWWRVPIAWAASSITRSPWSVAIR